MNLCDKCMKKEFCDMGTSESCADFQSLAGRLKKLQIDQKSWGKFSAEWEQTRKTLRKLLGYEREVAK